MSVEDAAARIEGYTTELETGIFNLVVSLCQQKASHMSMPRAKAEVAEYLNRLSNGLITTETAVKSKE